jgi:Tfp pilus assembly protein PilO
MQKSKDKQRPTLEQLRAELASLTPAVKRTLEELKAELAALTAEIKEAG